MSTRSYGFGDVCSSMDLSGINVINGEFFFKNAADLFTVAKSKLYMPFCSPCSLDRYRQRSCTSEISKNFDKSLLVG